MTETNILPERAIKNSNEDVLGYRIFAEKLANALITKDENEHFKSTGVVIGLTGEWGTGKSSILNLLEEELLKEKYQPDIEFRTYKPIILQFNPWLITCKADVISQFITELKKKISDHGGFPYHYRDRYDQSVDEILEELTAYAEILTPLLDIALPGASVPAKFGLKLFKKGKEKQLPLSSQKNKVSRMLSTLSVPIIVMIDELDRVDDDEIKLMVQIVKSVVDFPSISYVIAYDKKRVAEALARKNKDNNNIESGYAYLEKIVQVQIPIPTIFPHEICKYFEEKICLAVDAHSIQEEFGDNFPRLEEFYEEIFPAIVSSPRTVNRLVSSYLIRKNMVGKEVSPTDIIAWEVLSLLSPIVTDRITNNYRPLIDGSDYLGLNFNELTEGVDLEGGKLETLKKILYFLFPNYTKNEKNGVYESLIHPIDFEETNRQPTDIKNHIPFIKLIRLGMTDDFISRSDITRIMHSNKNDQLKEFAHFYMRQNTNQSLESFWSEFIKHSPSVVEPDHIINTIHNFVTFLDGMSKQTINDYVEFYNFSPKIARSLPSLLIAENNSDNNDMLATFLKDGHYGICAHILMGHMHHYGLHGWNAHPSFKVFLSEQKTKHYINLLAKCFENITLELMTEVIVSPVRFFLRDVDKWGEQERAMALNAFEDQDILDLHVLLTFKDETRFDFDALKRLLDLDEYFNLIERRSHGALMVGFDPLIDQAYQIAMEHNKARLKSLKKSKKARVKLDKTIQKPHQQEMVSVVDFDYSTKNGLVIIGEGDQKFGIKFNKAGDKSIHINSHHESISKVARVKGAKIFDKIEFSKLDSSSKTYTVQQGEIAVFKNKEGYYAQIKITGIKDDTRNDAHDQVTFEYEIGDKSGIFEAI